MRYDNPAMVCPLEQARVLVVDADPALSELIAAWLAELGCQVKTCASAAAALGCEGHAATPFDLVIVDLPYARQGMDAVVALLGGHHPGVPLLALSSTFFPGIDACGSVAAALGVDCALPKPLSRSALADAVRRLLSR